MKLTRRSFLKFLWIGVAVAVLPRERGQQGGIVENHTVIYPSIHRGETWADSYLPSGASDDIPIFIYNTEQVFVSHDFHTANVPTWKEIIPEVTPL